MFVTVPAMTHYTGFSWKFNVVSSQLVRKMIRLQFPILLAAPALLTPGSFRFSITCSTSPSTGCLVRHERGEHAGFTSGD